MLAAFASSKQKVHQLIMLLCNFDKESLCSVAQKTSHEKAAQAVYRITDSNRIGRLTVADVTNAKL